MSRGSAIEARDTSPRMIARNTTRAARIDSTILPEKIEPRSVEERGTVRSAGLSPFPYAGMTQIRLLGCSLRPVVFRPPLTVISKIEPAGEECQPRFAREAQRLIVSPAMRQAVILANGAPPPHEVLQRAIGSSTLFICADGGANTARVLGARPAAIIGDFDSVTPETLEHFADVPQIRDAGEDRTDTEKAIEHVLSKGRFQEITLLGASSGRLDHEMEHVGLMRRYLHRVRIVVESGFGRAYA